MMYDKPGQILIGSIFTLKYTVYGPLCIMQPVGVWKHNISVLDLVYIQICILCKVIWHSLAMILPITLLSVHHSISCMYILPAVHLYRLTHLE